MAATRKRGIYVGHPRSILWYLLAVAVLTFLLLFPGWLFVHTFGISRVVRTQGMSRWNGLIFLASTGRHELVSGHWHIEPVLDSWVADGSLWAAQGRRLFWVAFLFGLYLVRMQLVQPLRYVVAVFGAFGSAGLLSDFLAFVVHGGVMDWMTLDKYPASFSPSDFAVLTALAAILVVVLVEGCKTVIEAVIIVRQKLVNLIR